MMPAPSNETKQTSNCLSGQSDDLALLLTTLGDGIWEWNVVTGTVFFSATYQKMLGYPHDGLNHHVDEWIHHLHPDDARHAMQMTRNCLEGKTLSFENEHRLRCHDQSWKWVRSRVVAVAHGQDGRPTRLLGIISDITQQHAIAEQQKKRQALLWNFSHHLHGIFLFQIQRFPDGRLCFPYTSKALTDLFQIHPEQVKFEASAIFSRVHPNDQAELKAGMIASAQNLNTWEFSYRVEIAAHCYCLQGEAYPERLIDGSTLWHGYFNDVSTQQNLQQQLQLTQQKLSLTQAAYRHGMFEFNLQTGQGVCSPEYAALLGFDPDEIKNTHNFWQQFWTHGLHPDDLASFKQAYQSHITGHGVKEYRCQFRQKNKAGEWRWILSIGKIIEWDQQSRPLRMIAAQTDISAQIEAQKIAEAALHYEKLLNSSLERNRQLARDLEILMNNAPIGMYFVSEGILIRANPALAELFQYADTKALIGHKVRMLFSDDVDYQNFLEQTEQKLREDLLIDVKWRLKTTDGQTILVRMTGRALPHYSKASAWMIQPVVHDELILKI